MNRDEAHRLLALAREAAPELLGPNPEPWLDRIDAEQLHLRRALEWFLEEGDGRPALELAASVWPYWWGRGHLDEGRQLLDAALTAPGAVVRAPVRAQALRGAGTLAFRQGRTEQAEAWFEEGYALAEELGEQKLVVLALTDLARIALRRGDYETVRARSEEARALARARGAREDERGPVHLLAAAARMQGRLADARQLYGESLELLREVGNRRVVAGELHNLGHVELHDGDLVRAKELFRESLDLVWELRDLYLLPYCVCDFGIVALADGDLERAARLLAAGTGLFEETGAVPDPDDQVEIENALVRLRATLDDELFTTAWTEGRRLAVNDVANDALRAVERA
jgi:tetratricopeptide (TPR) repeat protein